MKIEGRAKRPILHEWGMLQAEVTVRTIRMVTTAARTEGTVNQEAMDPHRIHHHHLIRVEETNKVIIESHMSIITIITMSKEEGILQL